MEVVDGEVADTDAPARINVLLDTGGAQIEPTNVVRPSF